MGLFVTEPIHLVPGEQKPYQRERPNTWVFRLLGLPSPLIAEESPWYLADFGHHTVSIFDETATHDPFREIKLTPERFIALEAWARRQMHPTEDMERRTIVIALSDPTRQIFILQVKDDDHPVEEARGKRSLVSANRIKGENIPETVHRNLYQEVVDPCVADDILKRMFPLPLRMMYSPRLDAMIMSARYVAIAESERHFMYWSEKLLHDPGVVEAIPTCLSIHDVRDLARMEHEQPGSAFVASHHELLLEVASEI